MRVNYGSIWNSDWLIRCFHLPTSSSDWRASSRLSPLSKATIRLVQVVFHPSYDSSPIILLVLQFGAGLLCPEALIQCYCNSTRPLLLLFFFILLRHSLIQRLTNWPRVSSGWHDRHGIKAAQLKWKDNTLIFTVICRQALKGKLWSQWIQSQFALCCLFKP